MLCKFHFPQLMLWEWIGKEHQIDIYTFIQTLHLNLKPLSASVLVTTQFLLVRYAFQSHVRIHKFTFLLYKIKMCSLPLIFLS